MQILHDIQPLHTWLADKRRSGHRIALVPTMGNLHEGHLTLVDRARQLAEVVVATAFVNPLQFAPGEDYDRYPRTLEADTEKLQSRGCDLLFAPDVATLYPRGVDNLSCVEVPGITEILDGAYRPGHFAGVATVVTVLFNLIQPDAACFGEKDFQQLVVIRQLVADLHFPIAIEGVPTVRHSDGLALSSRNGYLNAKQRQQAPVLYGALSECREALASGQDVTRCLDVARQKLTSAGFRLDYFELRGDTLQPVTEETRQGRLLAAGYLGDTRLIDNVPVELPG